MTCEECDKEINISFVRLQQMIQASYDLRTKNNKLRIFLRDLDGYADLNDLKIDAKELLKEIGEV